MKVLEIVYKDLKIILADKKVIAIMILMPIILTIILGGALSSSFSTEWNRDKISVAIVKQYQSQKEKERFLGILNQQINKFIALEDLDALKKGIEETDIDEMFTNTFLGNEDIQKIMDYTWMEETDARNALEGEKVSAVIILPENFIYDMYVNYFTPFRNRSKVKLLTHPEHPISGQIVESIVKGYTDIMSSMIIGKNIFWEMSMTYQNNSNVFKDIEKIIQPLSENIEKNTVVIETIKVKGQQPLSSRQYYAAAMAVMFILFGAAEGGKMLLEEKEQLTYQRMVIAGISKWRIISGKFFTIFVLALIQTTVMVLFTTFVLGVNWGNPIFVALITICAVFSIAGLGILIAAVAYKANNYKVADLFQGIVIHIMAFFGGSFIPISMLPPFLQNISYLTINGLALKAYERIMLGDSLSTIVPFLLGLMILGMVLAIIGIYILKIEEGQHDVKHHQIKIYEIER